MKKYLAYILVIAALGVAAVWLIITKTNSTAGDEKALRVKDAKKISKIVLSDTDNKTITLTKGKDHWIINSKYEARDELVQSIMEVFERITILCPVQKAAHDNVMHQMLEYHIKVEVYDDGDEKAEKIYYVGGPTPDNQGTYILQEVNGEISTRPYIAYMPGLNGYVTPRFNPNEENWRSKLLFGYQPGDIKSLSLEYPGEEQKSFTIERLSGDSFAVQPKEAKFVIKQVYEQKYVRAYLDFFSSIYIESFDNSDTIKDSLRTAAPYCVFAITNTKNEVNRVKLYHMELNRRSKMQYDTKGNAMPYDVDHFYAFIHDDKDFAVVQYYVFGKLLREYKDFFFKPGTKPQ